VNWGGGYHGYTKQISIVSMGDILFFFMQLSKRNMCCRSGFTILPPVSLQEQYRCGSFVGGGFGLLGASYEGIRWTRGFTWFGPPERNTLRPRAKGVVLMCLNARLRSLLFSPSVRACGVHPLWLSSARTFYSPRAGSYREAPWPDRWPRGW
jgi:hypothetical protein